MHLLFDGEMFVLLLHAWKLTFLKFSHKQLLYMHGIKHGIICSASFLDIFITMSALYCSDQTLVTFLNS